MITLLNTAIMTGGNGTYRLSPVTTEEASRIIKEEGFESAIGHDATAAALSELLGVSVPVDRAYAKQEPGSRALVFKLRGRLEEGEILSRDEIDELGYDLYWLDFEPQVRFEVGSLHNPVNIGDGWSVLTEGRAAVSDSGALLRAAVIAQRHAEELPVGSTVCLFCDGRLPAIGWAVNKEGVKMDIYGFSPSITFNQDQDS